MSQNSSKPRRRPPPLGLLVLGRFFGMIWRVIATVAMVGIITGCIVACVLTVYILRYIGADNHIDLESVKMGYTSIIYATDKKTGEDIILKRLYYGGEDRTWVDYGDISDWTKKAIVSIEDKRFWTHDGVDWRRTVTAFVGLFMPIEGTTTGGGSTITQQLIKNITQESEPRVERKVREIFRALDLSKRHSRESILEAYLNLVPLGNGTNGIQAAANFYFGKNAADLTLAESAAIVGITQYPGRYDPLVNPENNRNRQIHILDEMLKQGVITQDEYDKAAKEELNFRSRDDETVAIIQPSSYFVDHVINEVINDLMEREGMTKSYATERIMKGGYRIYTTVDIEMQAYLEEFFLNDEKFPRVNNVEYPQSATVIIDPNGKILATVGGIGEKKGERTFNRATMSRRHPGSAIKPIGAYSLAIEHGHVTWSTIIVDSPLVGAPDNWSPNNYYAGFSGPVTVDTAIQRSINTVAAKVVMILTARRVFDFLHDDLEFTGLVEREVRGNQVLTDVALSPMSLGALTYGVSPLEMAGAYQMFVNGGKYTRPYSYTRIEDANGRIIMEKDTTPRYVIGEDTAVVMNKLLQRVVNGPVGTGKNARLDGNMPTAGKTGTSQDDVNQWFMGFTPYYIAPAWLGYDETNRVVVDSNGRRSVVPNKINYSTYPPPVLWKSMMGPLHTDLEPIPFIESPNVVSMTYCTTSGDIATSYCPTTGSGWYKKSRIPSHCSLHTSAPVIDTDDQAAGPDNGTDINSGSSGSSGNSSGSSSNGGTPIGNQNLLDSLG